jgi:uncharacterized protein
MNMPLIKKIVEFTKTLKLKHNRIIFSMTTNGVLLEKNLRYLVHNDFKLLISLDGNYENNEFRKFHNGKSSFPLIEKNINHIKNEYPEYFLKNVKFNSVIHCHNSINSVHNYFYSNYKKYPSISALSFTGINKENKDKFFRVYRNVNKSFEEANNSSQISDDMFTKIPKFSELIQFTHLFSKTTYSDYNDLFSKKNNNGTLVNGTCSPFAKKMFVTVRGSLLACERIGHEFKLGHIKDDKVHISTKIISNMYNKYFENLYNQCSSCYRQNTCNQCIMTMDNLEGNPNCNKFSNITSFSNFLSNKISLLESDVKYYKTIMEDVYADA